MNFSILIALLLPFSSLYPAPVYSNRIDSELYAPLENEITEILEDFKNHTQIYLNSLLKSTKILEEDLTKIATVNPENEFTQAIAWLNYQFIHYMCINYAVEQHIVENFRDIVASLINYNEQSWSGIPEDLVLNIFPLMMQRFIYFAYRDIKTVTTPNWQMMYNLSLHYIRQYMSTLDFNEDGYIFFTRALMASKAYSEMNSFIEKLDKTNSELLEEYSEDLPEYSPLHLDGDALGEALDRLIVGALSKRNSNRDKLIVFLNEDEVLKLVDRYVPKGITDMVSKLGDALKIIKLSWDWMNTQISRVTDTDLKNFEESLIRLD